MTSRANKAVARRFYEEFVGTGRVDKLESIISPSYTEVFDGTDYPVGIEGAKAHIIGVRQTYPDLAISVDRQIAEGDWVVTCITATGTHEGEWIGIHPTGKKVVYTAVNVDRIVDGRIVEHSGAANLLGPLMQIGAISITQES